jgi:octaprenyl-diphosphate synthase
MDNLSIIKKPVDSEIEEFEKHFSNSINSKVPLLETITNYIIRRKGKQIRPLFVFLSAKMLGEINRSTYTAATLIELLHTATLLHDDVVDESYERRNHFSINAIWKSKIAVLVGDYFLSRGLLVAVAEKQYKLLETVSVAVQEMSEGELLQIQTSKSSLINIDVYFDVIQKKTASLIASCTKCGAQSVTDDAEIQEKMKLFGTFTGIAFQIKDDLFDYQKTGITGKPTGNDIKEKKYTLPLILALNNSETTERKRIIKLVNNNDTSTSKIKEVIDFVIRNKGIEETEKYLEEYKTKALNILSEFPQNEANKSLNDLVDYVIKRNK